MLLPKDNAYCVSYLFCLSCLLITCNLLLTNVIAYCLLLSLIACYFNYATRTLENENWHFRQYFKAVISLYSAFNLTLQHGHVGKRTVTSNNTSQPQYLYSWKPLSCLNMKVIISTIHWKWRVYTFYAAYIVSTFVYMYIMFL